MAIIKKFSSFQNLSGYGVLINDTNPNSTYFRITELGENFTGGKNGFLIEGSECLKETTEIKVEILDVNGNPIYFEPGKGAPGYYEGLSKVVGVYIYEDTPIGLGKITVLGELKSYFDENDNKVDIPDDWKGVYNVKWEKQINVNRNLANESRVRFYKRPKITIEELSKPLFTKTIPTITQSGSLDGIPQVPVEGQDYREYAGGVLYKLKVNSGPNFTSSIDENVISFPTLNYFPTVKEVLSETEVLVDSPYTSSDGLVQPFSATEYTSSFENNAGAIITESALTGSFAKIKITNLKTFVGDVARVKVFRKSRNETGDFQFVQEQLLESTELLKDITTTTDTELSYGVFDDYNLTNYWISGSTTHPITLNNTELLNGVKIDYAGTGTQLLYTSESIAVGDNIEYNLSFKTKLSGSVDETKQINAYLSSSEFTQSVVVVSGSADTLQKFDVSKNIISTNSGSARLVFEVNGDDWYISNVSFKNAQESSFSPDEFTLVQEVPRKLDSEFFDFKFEFYDINNNFIPVKVKGSKEFSGGNLTSLSNVRLLEFETDRTAFRFSSGSLGNPPFQQSRFRVTSNGLTGSITFESAAFDKDGVYIDPSSYSGAYPGGLTSNNVLTIASFSGSDTSVTVGSITYTASIEDKEEFETITRFEDGEPASALIVTTNQNQFFYKATDLSVEPSGQVITIQAQRKNLASDTTTITANSGSGKPGLTVGSTTNGITTFTLNASDYPFGTGNTTYEFSGSDEFGSVFVDRITVSPVKKLDGVGLNLTNTNASFTANAGGSITGDLHSSSGSVDFRIGSEAITFENSLSTNNRFNIAGVTGSGVTPTDTNPTKNEYSISAFTANSGSLTININYKDGSGDVSEFQQIVNYTKALQGVQGASGSDGADGASGGAVGIVYRGEYSSGDTYVSQSDPGRLDVVKYSDAQAGDNYWIANNSGSLGQPSPSSSDWQAFGEEFTSVATDILFAQDVYADRTVNVGSSGSNPVIALNSDHANSNANPYIGMNITSYAANEGVYFGYDGGTPKLSLKGGASDGFLTWDGSNLNIQGAITITGGATADSLSALNSTTASLNTSVTNINTSTASLNTSVTNINSTTSSLNTSVTNINSTTESLQGEVDGISAITTSLENPSEYSFGPDALFDLAAASTPSTTGLYLGSTNMGYYNSGWKTYMDNTGQFYLTGSGNNYLIWDGSTLDIAGAITIRPGGNAATSTDVSTAATNAVTSGSNAASNAQTNAQNFATTAASSSAANASGSAITTSRGELNASSSVLAGDITTAQNTANTAQTTANAANASASTDPTTGQLVKSVTPAGEGLFMGSSELGYFSGSNWQTYMSSSGDFFLEGDGGSLTWDYISSSLTIQGRISGSSIQGGTIQGSSIAGGEINVPNADAPLFHVDGAGNMSAQNVSISGSVNLDAGTIGGWVVDDEDAGGSLRDEDSRIVFNPDLPEMQLYDSSGNRKVAINPNDSLSSPGSSDIYASSLGSSVNGSSTSVTSGDSYSSVSSAFVQGSASNSFNITTAGSWEVQDINITSTFTQTTTSIPSVTATVSSPAYNYYPSYPYAVHGGQASGGTSYVYLYLSLYSTADELIHREQIAYSYARGAYNSGASYTAVAASYSPTGFDWQYQSGGSTISAASYASSTYNDEFLVSVESTGNHYLVYEQKVVNRSAYKTDVDNYGNTTTTFSTFTKSGLNITGLDTSITLAAPSNFVEINAGGFQAVSDSSQYVRIRRVASGQTNPTLMNVVGGSMYLGEYGDEIDDVRIYNYGKSTLRGENVLGDSWTASGGNAGDKPRGVKFEGNVNWKSHYSGLGGTSTQYIANTSTSSNLGYQIAANGNFVVLDPSGTRYYTLPCRYNGTYYANGDKFEDGDMIVLWNRRDNNSNCRVYGMVDGGVHNHYTIAGGKALLLIYWDNFGSSRGWDSSIGAGWVIIGSYDNTG